MEIDCETFALAVCLEVDAVEEAEQLLSVLIDVGNLRLVCAVLVFQVCQSEVNSTSLRHFQSTLLRKIFQQASSGMVGSN